MMSQFRGRGPQSTISLIRGSTKNLDTGQGMGQKKVENLDINYGCSLDILHKKVLAK